MNAHPVDRRERLIINEKKKKQKRSSTRKVRINSLKEEEADNELREWQGTENFR